MQQPSANDYINWLRMQDGQLAMEETQLAAEEQWLQQTLWEHNNNTGARWGQAILHSLAKFDQPTSWKRQSFWLRNKQHELAGKRATLQARRAWLQQEKAKYGLP
jgi:hypothetical protein